MTQRYQKWNTVFVRNAGNVVFLMMWINPEHLVSRAEFCVKMGPEFSEPDKTRIVPAVRGGGDKLDPKLIQIYNTIIMSYIT